jgi:hypothetical protein
LKVFKSFFKAFARWVVGRRVLLCAVMNQTQPEAVRFSIFDQHRPTRKIIAMLGAQ